MCYRDEKKLQELDLECAKSDSSCSSGVRIRDDAMYINIPMVTKLQGQWPSVELPYANHLKAEKHVEEE